MLEMKGEKKMCVGILKVFFLGFKMKGEKKKVCVCVCGWES